MFKKLHILRLLIIFFFLASTYAFGAFSVKYNIFPFGYQISHWFSWTFQQLNTSKTHLLQSKMNVETYAQNIQTLLFDFDIKWISVSSEEIYGAIIPITKDSILHISQYGMITWKNLLTGKNFNHNIPNLELNSNEFELFTLKNKITSAHSAFGVKDAQIINSGENTSTIIVSATYFDTFNDCVDLRVFSIQLETPKSGWKQLFVSKPCINSYDGMPSWGGGLAANGKNSVYLTIGDVLHDGVNNKDLVSDKVSDYGKIFDINLETQSYQIHSIGHRNPQGIIKTAQNLLLAVEHGPEGGDELNLILEGKHYGWPMVTFGVDYGSFKWPSNKKNGFHEGYEQPIMTWTPAIGPSDLDEVVSTKKNAIWENDIIISGLRSHSLLRLKLKNKSVIFIEEIDIGRRLRKIKTLNRTVFLKDAITGEIGYFVIPYQN